MRYLITGATGFVGGHLAEACVQKEHSVSAIVRPNSDAGELEKLEAILYRGELSDAHLVRQAVTEADVIVHCAAKVGDWGPIDEYRRSTSKDCGSCWMRAKARRSSRFIL